MKTTNKKYQNATELLEKGKATTKREKDMQTGLQYYNEVFKEWQQDDQDKWQVNDYQIKQLEISKDETLPEVEEINDKLQRVIINDYGQYLITKEGYKIKYNGEHDLRELEGCTIKVMNPYLVVNKKITERETYKVYITIKDAAEQLKVMTNENNKAISQKMTEQEKEAKKYLRQVYQNSGITLKELNKLIREKFDNKVLDLYDAVVANNYRPVFYEETLTDYWQAENVKQATF